MLITQDITLYISKKERLTTVSFIQMDERSLFMVNTVHKLQLFYHFKHLNL